MFSCSKFPFESADISAQHRTCSENFLILCQAVFQESCHFWQRITCTCSSILLAHIGKGVDYIWKVLGYVPYWNSGFVRYWQ